MSILFILIGCSLLLALFFLAAYIWAVKSGQMDDDYTPSIRILFDEIKPKQQEETTQNPSNEKPLIQEICK